ncbi:MAG: TetR/AcrR family transcriptional regulator [Bacteroidota bacterium]
MKTKQKIIQSATRYFNKFGFAAVSLHELARHLGMTRGNLTYHFKDKDELLEHISREMWTKIEEARKKSRQFPSFENLHNEVQLYYRFQKEYAFIFLDSHVLNHQLIKRKFREMTNQTIADNKATIAFSIQLGNMKKETFPGLYNNLAFVCWMVIFYCLSQQKIRGVKTGEDAEKLVWTLLLPHFTEKGIASFIEFFGEAYYHGLGDAFDPDLSQLISF